MTGTKILIVEDDAVVLELLRTYLAASGLDVLTATDGEEAVRIFRSQHEGIGVVISDLGLPRLGGWEAFQQMKAIDPKVKVLLTSGYFDSALRAEALTLGAVDFLQKPYKPADVLAHLSRLLSSH